MIEISKSSKVCSFLQIQSLGCKCKALKQQTINIMTDTPYVLTPNCAKIRGTETSLLMLALVTSTVGDLKKKKKKSV